MEAIKQSSDNLPEDLDLDALLASSSRIAAIWSVEDVQQIRHDLDDEQAWRVLQAVKDRHDCNSGITWETLGWSAADLYPKPDDE